MVICPGCEEDFSRPGQHWQLSSSCNHPDLPEKAWDVIVGTLMGDATLSTGYKNINYNIRVIQEKYLKYLRKIFPDWFIPGDIYIAEEEGSVNDTMPGRKIVRKHDFLGLRSVRHPSLTTMREKWYDGSDKIFPTDIDLNPIISKHWYVCDGNLSVDMEGERERVRISAVNEDCRSDNIIALFEEAGFPISYCSNGDFMINQPNSDRFFEWIGDPIPGYEYKWPERFK